jgi:hypothetical protein
MVTSLVCGVERATSQAGRHLRRVSRFPIALVVSIAACKPVPPPAPVANQAPPSIAHPRAASPQPEDVCCCERLHPPEEEAGAPWESRAAACLHGTPTLPDGRCIDWTRCGQPSGSHLTISDRPELAPPVAVARGTCCCSMPDWFRVVDISTCTSGCLEPEWCAAPPPKPVATHQPAPNADRCVQIADHFEPWRANPLWKDEISPRAKLIADCKAHHWSVELESCLLDAAGPLDLDTCIGL